MPVWDESNIYVIDTKNSQLTADAARKLQNIKSTAGVATRVFVRFIFEGRISDGSARPDGTGFTAWSYHADGTPKYTYYDDMSTALGSCLVPDV